MMAEENKVIEQWWRVVRLIIPYFLVVGAFQVCGIFLLGLRFKDIGQDLPGFQSFVMMLFTTAGTFLVIWLLRKYADKGTLASLGFKPFFEKDIFWGILMGFVIMLSGFLILLASHQIKYLNSNFVFSELLYEFLFLTLVAFTEELVLRGYVLTNLMGSMNKYHALLVSAVLFSLMHAANANYGWLPAVELFFAGVLLGLSYVYTRNLWFPVALHFSWNFFQAMFGFNVSGHHIFGIISHVRERDNLWNGGAFGFEGSVLSLILQVLAIAVVYFLFRKRKVVN